jgi:PBSX family phage portal protein
MRGRPFKRPRKSRRRDAGMDEVTGTSIEASAGEGAEEVDVIILSQAAEPARSRSDDPFMKVDLDSLHPEVRKEIRGRLRKRLVGREGAKSKALDEQQLTGYDVFELIPPPYDLNALAKLYEKNAAHNAAVTIKAINIVGLGYDIVNSPETELKIEQLQGNRSKLDRFINQLKKERIRLMRLIDSLNEEEEFSEIMVKVWTDVESLGNGYLEIGRTRGGRIGYIGHIPGHTMRIRAARDGFIQVIGNKYVFFRNFGDLETPNPLKNDPRPNEVMHFKKYSPHSTYYGIPDIIPAMPSVMGDALAKEYNIDYFENKAVPRYVFITKGVKLSQEAEQTLKEYFRNELKGKHHGTLYIPLPASMNQTVDARFEPIEVRPQDQSFVTYLRENRQEILMVHRVPPSKVGIYENTNLAVSRDADRTFKEQTCRPEQRRIEKKINKLIQEFAENKAFVLKFKEADIIDEDVRSRKHDRYLRTRVLKPNEVRAEIGYPAVPEGEQFLPVPGTVPAGNNPRTPPPPGMAEGNRRRTTDGIPSREEGRPDRAERGAEQALGRT